jgi:DNA-binding transcriptional ArsR family regulator
MLDRIFLSLSDPTRRAIVECLHERDCISVGELARPFAMSLPAGVKHIDVLSDAGLLRRQRVGRHVHCHLHREPIAAALEWLEGNAEFWNPKLDRLAEHAEAREALFRKEDK